jgi:hypothetical protein
MAPNMATATKHARGATPIVMEDAPPTAPAKAPQLVLADVVAIGVCVGVGLAVVLVIVMTTCIHRRLDSVFGRVGMWVYRVQQAVAGPLRNPKDEESGSDDESGEDPPVPTGPADLAPGRRRDGARAPPLAIAVGPLDGV